jgi:hypothetical protein
MMSCVSVEQTRALPIVFKNSFVQHSTLEGTNLPQTKIYVPLIGSGLTYWESIAITLCKKPTSEEATVLLDSHIESNGFKLTRHNNTQRYFANDDALQWHLEINDVFMIGTEKRKKCVLRGAYVEGIYDARLVITIIRNLHVCIESINVSIKGWKKRDGNGHFEEWDASIHSFKFYPNRVYSLRQVLDGCDALLSLRLLSCLLSPVTIEHKPFTWRAHIIANGHPTGIMVTSGCRLDGAIPNWILNKTEESKVGQKLANTERSKVLLVPAQYDDLWLEFDEDIAKLPEVPVLEVKELKMFSTNGQPYFASQ